MLLDKTLDLQKCWKEVPFVFRCIDGIGEIFVVVKGLESGIEAVRVVRLFR